MSSSQFPEDYSSFGNLSLEGEEDYDDLQQGGAEDPTTPRQPRPPLQPFSTSGSSSRSVTFADSYSGSETERDNHKSHKSRKMSSRSAVKQPSSSSKKHSSSKNKAKNDDWTDVTEPEERRRIQNRIAQRKFREKAREQKERSERESRNQAHAGSSYHVPGPDDLTADEDLSGIPWGGINMQHVFARGHESESRRGSRKESDPAMIDDTQYLSPYSGGYPQPPSWDGRDSGGEDRYYDDSSPYYGYDYDAPPGDVSGGR